MRTKREDIIRGTIRCAHRVGLPAVTVKIIGNEVGILGQGLYNHFGSKEAILSACFEYCREQLAALYRDHKIAEEDDFEAAVKKIWLRSFEYWIGHPDECAFYRNYRELACAAPPEPGAEEAQLQVIWRLVDRVEERYGVKLAVPRMTMLYYVRNLTPYLARAISDGIMEDTPQVREQLWRMVFGGLSALCKE